jgi:GntR family transcriptional regulator
LNTVAVPVPLRPATDYHLSDNLWRAGWAVNERNVEQAQEGSVMSAPAARLPRWMAVRNALVTRFEKGEWPPGVQLPPEPELATELGVSRATLREALRSLSEDGYIVRKPGAGTRSAHRRVPTSLDKNVGVAELIRSMGMVPGTSSLRFRLAEAPEDVARDLELGDQRQVAIIERVRTANGSPVIYSRHFYPLGDSCDERTLLDGSDSQSPYTFLEARAGIRMQYAKATISPAIADFNLARRLATSTGTLLMHFWQVGFDVARHPVIVSSEHCLADAFEFTIMRRGPRSDWQAHAEQV